MRKFLMCCVTFLLMSTVAYAEKGAFFLYGPENLQVTAVSPNGKWACGIVGDGATIMQGLLWNLVTGETTYLSLTDESTAMDVTDDGMVVGAFTDYTATENGAPISVAGFYKDGKWTRFDNSTIEGAALDGGEAYGVSDDGRFAVGATYINGKYCPVKWEDGVLKLAYKSTEGVAYTITGDGEFAAGWSTESLQVPSADSTRTVTNRVAIYWSDSEAYIVGTYPSIFDAGQKFSPDKSKLLCSAWGHSFVYDMITQERTELPWYSENCYNKYLYYIDNNGTVIGGEEDMDMFTGASDYYAYIYENGTAMKMVDWLAEKGVTVDDTKAQLIRGVDMSLDQKVMAFMTLINENGMLTGAFSSAILKLDCEVDYPAPVALKVSKLNGLNTVRLTWNAPLVSADNVVGYNVYCNGTRIVEGINEVSYMNDVVDGTYVYAVTALYEGENDDIVESEFSESVTIEIAAEQPNPVSNVEAHQVGYDDLRLRWESPASNLPQATYFDPSEVTSSFGGGSNSFVSAIRLGYDFVQKYSQDYAIARVGFMPGNEKAHYSIVVYVDEAEVYRQAVADSGLKYGRMNIVNLGSPVRFAENQMVYVAVEVDASDLSSSAANVIGMNYGSLVEGYSDLVRLLTEPKFYSLNRSAVDNGIGEMPISWAISAIFGKVDAEGHVQIDNDVVAGYEVYRDGDKLATVTDETYLDKGVSTGTHTYGVEVRYADESMSERESITVEMSLNVSACQKVTNVEVMSEPSYVKASWSAPLNNDERVVSYSGNEKGAGIKVNTSDLVEYTVAAYYPFSYVDWYEGYVIKSLRFYPTDEAVFTLVLEVDGVDAEMISIGELGEPDGYMLNQWNEYELNTPVTIKRGGEYMVKLICSEVDPTTTPISLDNTAGVTDVSDLFSWDYATFSSITEYVSVSGNWMLGMVVNNGSEEALPVDGYNVLIDGTQVNEDLVQETVYDHSADFKEADIHRLKVNVVYPSVGEVEGDVVFFSVSPAAVESVSVDRVNVYPNPAASYLRVDGPADRLVMYDLSGRKVAETCAVELDVTALPVGNYLLRVYAGDVVSTVKVVIVR